MPKQAKRRESYLDSAIEHALRAARSDGTDRAFHYAMAAIWTEHADRANIVPTEGTWSR